MSDSRKNTETAIEPIEPKSQAQRPSKKMAADRLSHPKRPTTPPNANVAAVELNPAAQSEAQVLLQFNEAEFNKKKAKFEAVLAYYQFFYKTIAAPLEIRMPADFDTYFENEKDILNLTQQKQDLSSKTDELANLVIASKINLVDCLAAFKGAWDDEVAKIMLEKQNAEDRLKPFVGKPELEQQNQALVKRCNRKIQQCNNQLKNYANDLEEVGQIVDKGIHKKFESNDMEKLSKIVERQESHTVKNTLKVLGGVLLLTAGVALVAAGIVAALGISSVFPPAVILGVSLGAFMVKAGAVAITGGAATIALVSGVATAGALTAVGGATLFGKTIKPHTVKDHAEAVKEQSRQVRLAVMDLDRRDADNERAASPRPQ